MDRQRSARNESRHLWGALLAVVAAWALWSGLATTPSAHAAPYAAGDSSANIALDRTNRWVLQRWVARHTGVVSKLYVRVKVEGSVGCPYGGRPGYAKGTTGSLLATTHPVLADGRPDLSVELSRQEAVPCGRERGESMDIDLNLPVTAGQELATVFRNVDPSPAQNFASLNFLYRRPGVLGANGRNERDASAPDAFYGLDPREIVGYSTDAGQTWSLPGGPYGLTVGGTSFIPTYIQEYADGRRGGQPYYSSGSVSGPVSMVYPKIAREWRITALGAYTGGPGAARVRLLVDGVQRANVEIGGAGMLRRGIAPVTAPAGSTVRIETVAGDQGLSLRKQYGDAVWAGIMRFGRAFTYHLEQDPVKAAPVYALPALGASGEDFEQIQPPRTMTTVMSAPAPVLQAPNVPIAAASDPGLTPITGAAAPAAPRGTAPRTTEPKPAAKRSAARAKVKPKAKRAAKRRKVARSKRATKRATKRAKRRAPRAKR